MSKKRKRKVKKGFKLILIIILIFILFLGYKMFIKKDNKEVKKENKVKVVEKKEKKDKSMSLVMVGDVLTHDSVLADAKGSDGTYDFSNMFTYIKPIIKDYDLKYVNEESIIGDPSLGFSGYPGFNAPEAIGDNLVDLGFNLIGLANNHAMDKGEKSILNSNNYWKSKNVITAGTYSSQEERDTIPTYEKNGIKYAFLSYTTVTNAKVPKSYLLNMYSDEIAKKDIDSIKDKVDVIIVAMHWGEEYIVDPVEEQKTIAKYLSDLGVNLIIGTHPHIIEPVGYVNDTLVIYSLGNFVSGQNPMGIDKIVGLMAGMDIVVKDKKVTFENLDYKLLYTYATASNTNYKVIPFDKLDDATLRKYGNYTVEELKNKYMEIVNREVNYGN